MSTLVGINGKVAAYTVGSLHLYATYGTDWFSAASLEHAREVARAHYVEAEQLEEDIAWLLDGLDQVDDDRVMRLHDDDGVTRAKPAAEWANENGPGFWATTNY